MSSVTRYRVFEGIELIFSDIRSDMCGIESSCGRRFFEINHCLEGRLEYEINGEFYYLAPGDISIGCSSCISGSAYFPQQHYRGVSIAVDLDLAPHCLSCFLDDVNVSPDAVAEKFCSGGREFIMRADESISHIFSEMYSVPESIRKGYFKVKIMELFLFLSTVDTGCNQSMGRRVSAAQVRLAKDIGRYLTENMARRVTLDMLAAAFHVSGTQIKNCFKAVYGTSLYSHIKTVKMQSAALRLAESELTVLEIAGEYGYDNGSKFASAFRSVMGMTPREYRQKTALKKIG